ncbi:MAG: DUF58 domain-containing protein [Candidatus Aenigmarchaeota archaeon]|nr:DUF58 domain-containing protein [Candidatus Aenigmarchaeota archaeon]
MDDEKTLLKRIRRIELKTKRLVDGLMQGAYYSIFKGRGIEFSEVREYHYGDDIRAIDWNVTARMNHPFVKEFVEERDLTVMIFFDVSGSIDFGTQDMLKREAAVELIASIAFSAIRNNDRVGLILASSKIEKYITPRKGKKHAMRIIREILYHRPEEKGTDLERPLIRLSKVMKKRGVIFIVSDFIEDLGKLEKPLRIMRKKHDVVAVRIVDVRESEIPDVGYVELEDGETGEHFAVNTSDPDFRKNFSRIASERDASIAYFMKARKIDFIQIPASDNWQKAAAKYFTEKTRRART